MHCKATGKSSIGVLTMVSQTPIDWYSKRQSTVATAAYGSELIAARTAVQQITDLRLTLRYLGVPIDGPSWLLGDNMSVITSCNNPHTTLGKRHNFLSYHAVCAAIASGMINLCHVRHDQNVADVLTKFLARNDSYPLVQPLLFWKGETYERYKKRKIGEVENDTDK